MQQAQTEPPCALEEPPETKRPLLGTPASMVMISQPDGPDQSTQETRESSV